MLPLRLTCGSIFLRNPALHGETDSNLREVVNTCIIYRAPQSASILFYTTIQNHLGAELFLNNSSSILADGARAIYSSVTESHLENTGLIDGDVVLNGQPRSSTLALLLVIWSLALRWHDVRQRRHAGVCGCECGRHSRHAALSVEYRGCHGG